LGPDARLTDTTDTTTATTTTTVSDTRECRDEEVEMTETSALERRLHELVAPIVADLQLDLYDLEYAGGVLRITIDTPPGSPSGVDVDALAQCTRLVSRELDHTDPIPGHYTLEVTSPGLERTLRRPGHFQREVGKTVAIRLRDVEAGQRRVSGVLVAADETTCTVRILPDGPGDIVDRVVPLDQIDRARTVFEWGPAPKPGRTADGSRPKSGRSPKNSGGKPGRPPSKPAKPPADSSARKSDPTDR
jgi:ribosome maturation factor RimP